MIVLAAGALALAGCSSTSAKVEHGEIHARTFSFVRTDTRAVPNYADKGARVHQAIHEAITRNLASRGVTRVDTGGDIIVGYLVITGNDVSTEMVDQYFGWSEDANTLHNKAQSAYTKKNNPNHFRAGTLLIDIRDSKAVKLLKRGYASRTGLQNLSDEDKAACIQEVVDEIFRDLRVAP